MIIDIKRVTTICAKLKITYQEFCFLYLVATRDTVTIIKYVKAIDGFNDDFRDRLEEKGLLLDMNKTYERNDEGERIVSFKLLHTTPKFDEEIKEAIIEFDIDKAYEELLAVYPHEFFMEDEVGRMKSYNARTGSFETNRHRYGNAIKGDMELHKRIVEVTKYGKENGLIKKGIQGYIEGRMWSGIEEQMNSGLGSVSSDLG